MNNLKLKDIFTKDIYPVEYYLEIPKYDSRIAILKFLDARETIGFALKSLIYADASKDNYIKAMHLRSAIIDLNNSFDLILQIPWMYYRAWSVFNNRNKDNPKLLNKPKIKRNTNGWVHKAEKNCSYEKLLYYLKLKNTNLETDFKKFYDTFINNRDKKFTIRSLCNTLKHNHVLSFEELYEHYNFFIDYGSGKVPLTEAKHKHYTLCSSPNPSDILATIDMKFEDDLSIDIFYINNDKFYYKDCTHEYDRYKIQDVLNECLDYYNNLVDLFESVYSEIYSLIPLNHIFNPDNIKESSEHKNLDKYFLK